MKILIADDHEIVRRGLIQLIDEMELIVKIDEANDGNEVVEKFRNNKYDLIILDISMPDRNGLEILTDIRKIDPKQKVLVLSFHPESHYAIRALKQGAYGYLTKNSAADELAEAIISISKGNKYITKSLSEKLVSHIEINSDKLPHELLSDREFQVLLKIASGKSITAISNELGINLKTVSTYKSRINRKMGLKNNYELTNYAIKNNLIE